ncbi:ribose-phosphate diphosphokinase [Marinimicrococcus flavescens]|uniref:ribose-phosphate diphosphokinase n=1 Tax=Marinimicrococcus flavescens TaxID=3031815 RepID=A0AAP4D704_9PROT|nr:ribose-phosphate diphosphokinase [Marinimicrococcus flavescens]
MLFALEGSRALGERIATRLGLTLAPHEERIFEDGEHKGRPLVPVRGHDVHVLLSLFAAPSSSIDQKLCRLLFFIGALKDAGAGRVTAITPHLAYGRKDRRTKPQDPVTTRYVARLFEAVGTDQILAVDVHNEAAFENAFRCGAESVSARGLFVRHLLPLLEGREAVVVAPDTGGSKRAEALRLLLETALGRPVGSALMEKHRSGGEVSGTGFVGEVAGRVAIVPDDLVSTGGTMRRCAAACRERGAEAVFALATHGLFAGEAAAMLADPVFTGIVVTSSVPAPPLPVAAKTRLTMLDLAPLLAEAVRRLHGGGSLAELSDSLELPGGPVVLEMRE